MVNNTFTIYNYTNYLMLKYKKQYILKKKLKYFIQGVRGSALFTGTAYRLKYFTPIPKLIKITV